MATKSPIQEFQENWNKRVGWAQSQGISNNSIQPVLQLDAQRLKNGDYIYSDPEAYRAIQASATLTDPVQAQPISHSLNPLNVAGNFFSDMRNFYSGLGNLVVHPMGNLIDPVIHGLEGLPHTFGTAMADAASGKWAATFETLSQNQLLDFLPGVSDAGILAKEGINGLIEHPFYSVIDVAPWGMVLGKLGDLTGLSKLEGGVGDIARSTSKRGMYGGIGTALGKIPTGGERYALSMVKKADEAGQVTEHIEGGMKKRTAADSMGSVLRKHGLDKISKDLFGFRGMLTEQAQNFAKQNLTELFSAGLGSSDVDAGRLYEAVTTGNRDIATEAVKNDDALWDAAKTYVAKSNELLQSLHDGGVETGMVFNPFTHGYEIYSPSLAKEVTRLHGLYIDAQGRTNSLNEDVANLTRLQAVGVFTKGLFEVPPEGGVASAEHMTPDYPALTGRTPIGKTRRPFVAGTFHPFAHLADELNSWVTQLAPYLQGVEDDSKLSPVERGGVRQNLNATQRGVLRRLDMKLRNAVNTINQGGGFRNVQKALNDVKKSLNSKFMTDTHRNGIGLVETGPMPELRLVIDRMLNQDLKERVKQTEQYKALSSKVTGQHNQSLTTKLRNLEAKRRGLQTKADTARDNYRKWFYDNQPTRFTPLMKRALQTRQIARMYLQRDKYPMLADQIVDPKILSAMNKMGLDKDPKDITVNDVHGALQLSSLMASEQSNVTGRNLIELAQQQMMSSVGDSAMKSAMVVNKDLFDKEFEEVGHTWQVLSYMGYDPAWVPSRTTKDVAFAQRPYLDIKDRVTKLSNMYERTGSTINDEVMDPVIALHTAAVELLTHQKLVSFHEGMIGKLTVKAEDIDREWETVKDAEIRRVTKSGKNPLSTMGISENNLKTDWINDHYAEYNPTEYGIKSVDYASWFNPAEGIVYLPKFIKDGLDKMQRSERGISDLPFEKAIVKGNSMFKSTLLTFSPRYAFHMSVGQAFMVMLKTDPVYLSKLGQAYALIKSGKVDPRLPTHVSYDDAAVPVHQYLAGRTMGRLFHESTMQRFLDEHGRVATAAEKGAGILNGFHHIVTLTNNMQRVAVYLTQLERRGGDAAAEDEALALTTKIFGDTRRMSPMERTITKTLIPFYGWTRTVLGYALSLPADNPWRVMILGNLSEQEQNDWNSSLPDNMKYLMFLGQPDASGNVTAIDVRGIDPMRDVGTYFTLAGFTSMFSPYIQAVGDLAGINPSTATPELYPDITYNDFYGTEQAKPDIAQGAANAIEGIVPQAAALDYAFKISSQMKYSRANDTKGFAYTLADYLNLPYLPQHINIRQEIARTTVDRYSVLEQQVEQALQTGNFSGLMGYNAVPYRGWDMDPRKLATVAANLFKQTGVPADQSLAPEVPYARQGEGIDQSAAAANDQPSFPAVGASG